MKRLTAASIALSLAVTACSQKPSASVTPAQTDPLGSDSVAVVNSIPVPAALLERLSLNAAQREASALTPEQRDQLVEQLVLIRLLADAAETERLDLDRTVAAEMELQRLQSLARAATDAYRMANPPTEAELRAAYEANLPRYLATQHKARHILVSSEAQAKSIIEELDAGADFAEMARQYSTGPTGPRGGDLDWFTADSMVEPFAEAVKAAEVGVHTPTPVETQFGWHIILVEDIREQQPPGLEAVRNELVAIVDREKLDSYITALRSTAAIEINLN